MDTMLTIAFRGYAGGVLPGGPARNAVAQFARTAYVKRFLNRIDVNKLSDDAYGLLHKHGAVCKDEWPSINFDQSKWSYAGVTVYVHTIDKLWEARDSAPIRLADWDNGLMMIFRVSLKPCTLNHSVPAVRTVCVEVYQLIV